MKNSVHYLTDPRITQRRNVTVYSTTVGDVVWEFDGTTYRCIFAERAFCYDFHTATVSVSGTTISEPARSLTEATLWIISREDTLPKVVDARQGGYEPFVTLNNGYVIAWEAVLGVPGFICRLDSNEIWCYDNGRLFNLAADYEAIPSGNRAGITLNGYVFPDIIQATEWLAQNYVEFK